MIDFHYWPTPNGWKISIMLEECGLPYKMVPRRPPARARSTRTPSSRSVPMAGCRRSSTTMRPAVRSRCSNRGAILLHLADKAGRFAPVGDRARKELMEWLFWQVGNLGPMAGQLSHFVNYAQGEHPYSRERYAGEYARCLGVLERRLEGRAHILGDAYSIADMASWPWGADRQAARPGARTNSPTWPAGARRSSSAPQCSAASTSARSCVAARRRPTTSDASCSTRRHDIVRSHTFEVTMNRNRDRHAGRLRRQVEAVDPKLMVFAF